MDPRIQIRIWIHSKMSWIRNTGSYPYLIYPGLWCCTLGNISTELGHNSPASYMSSFYSPYLVPVLRILTFWCGSGSADLCLWLVDPDSDPDPAFFVIDLQDANKKLIFNKFNKIFCLLLFEGTFTSFLIFKDIKSKRSRKTVGIKVFLTIFAQW